MHTCGITQAGLVTCWGNDGTGRATPPAGAFVARERGPQSHLRRSRRRTVTCWGANDFGECEPPAATFEQVSAGYDFSCGLLTGGGLACWGKNDLGQATPPAGGFFDVSAGASHSCGRRRDGTIACWGYNGNGRAPVIAVAPDALPVAVVGVPFSVTLTASGGSATRTTTSWPTDSCRRASRSTR